MVALSFSLGAIDYVGAGRVSYGRGKLQVANSVEMKPKRLSAAFMLRAAALLMFYLLAGVFYSRFQHSVYDHLRVSLSH